MEIYKAIDKARKSIGAIQATGYNPHFKSLYMTLEGIYEELLPVLDSNNLMLQQYVDGNDLVTLVFCGAETLKTVMPLIGANNMQQFGSAITYARRYSIVALFGILDKDDDGSEVSIKLTPEQVDRAALEKDLYRVIKSVTQFNTLKDELGMAQIAGSKDMSDDQLKKMIDKAKEIKQ